VQAAPPSGQLAQNAPAVDAGKVEDLLNLDVAQLTKVSVGSGSRETNLTAPSSQVDAGAAQFGDATSTADLLTQSPSVTARRISPITLDPQVRGYNSSQIGASANGMTELKTRLDIDSVFSQIDPGIVENVTIIDGPYSSLYGPGFAFLAADLTAPPRFAQLEAHFGTNFVFGSNASTLYNRDNLLAGGKDWGAIFSYGLRSGDDYLTGGSAPYRVPSSYHKWDTLLSVSKDLGPSSRIECDFLHTEINNTELPGVVYDLDNSTNSQYNVRYIVQEDPKGPRELVVQSWFSQTAYHGDASRLSKQDSFYQQFIAQPDYFDDLVNTVGQGRTQSLGIRCLRTLGDAGSAQWTVGADLRRVNQFYQEQDLDAAGNLGFQGNLFGIPHSQMDDYGILTNLALPAGDNLSLTIGGRLDYCKAWVDADDPVITEFAPGTPPEDQYYSPGVNEPSDVLPMAYLTGKYKLTGEYTLKAGVAYAERMPNLNELYGDEPFVPMFRFGNSSADSLSTLKPERDLQLDLGLTYETKPFTWGARGFYAMIHDYILPIPSYINPSPPFPPILAPHVLGRNFSDFPAPERMDIGTPNENADTNSAGYQYWNIDLATLLGGDLFAEARLREGLTVFGSISYVRGTDESPVQFIPNAALYSPAGHVLPLGGTEGLPGIYPLNGALGVRIFEPAEDRWSMEFSARMVARQEHLAVSLSEIGTPGFAVFGLRGYYRVRKNVRVSLDLENLFNKFYSEPDSLAMIGPNGLPTFVKEPGFSALLGLDTRF
jgi:outer membrane receptor protein involved in Fe transport